jgi:large conductance mechanosensitive channel
VLKDFKKFILRGNVVDLAVAVLIGAAFNSVVSSLVKDMITPLISAITGSKKGSNFSNLSLTVHGSKLLYGDFVNSIVSFLIVAFVVFFFVVQPINRLVALGNRNKGTDEPTEKKCPECLSTIPKAARRCAFCTAKLKAA